MFKYCPSCASSQIQFIENKKFFCPACGYVYYHNTAAASGCIISRGHEILVLVRSKDPSRGKLDFPGGFVDPGESVLDGLRRECMEELCWAPKGDFSFFASFPNTYLYRDVLYNTCDLFFTVQAPDLRLEDLKLDTDENTEAFFIDPRSVKPSDLAFNSTRLAVKAYLKKQF